MIFKWLNTAAYLHDIIIQRSDYMGKIIITKDMTKCAYEVSKQVLMGEISRSDAKFKINKECGMKSGSANDYVTVFLAMINGKIYKRTINAYSTEYYFDNIHKDFGVEYLLKAISATELHTAYYATQRKGNLRGIEEITKEYKRTVSAYR